MKIILSLLSIIILISCTNENNMNSSLSLEQVWASDTLLQTPESVIYDKNHDVLYVSNINLNPWEKDGNGFISKMDLNGNIIKLKWIEGLDGPKGMGIVGNSLFTADIDKVVEINIEEGEIINRYVCEDSSSNLNDITTSPDGSVYISGSGNGKIYQLKDGELKSVVEDIFQSPNGLYFNSGKLLILGSHSQQLKSLDLNSNNSSILADSLGSADGIVSIGNGNYLTSDWLGEIFYISSKHQRTKLLDTRKNKINAADIGYIMDKNLLLVPTFFNNRVVAYKIIK